jgi:hypothetical protein
MKPIDFVVFNGDSPPNTSVYLIAEEMKKLIKIVGEDGEYEALSYYFNEKTQRMTLNIRKKE